MRDEAWRAAALCIGTDPELFYPPPGNNGHDAKRICRRCPVAADCLDYALAGREEYGIWGGVAMRERRRMIGRGDRDRLPQRPGGFHHGASAYRTSKCRCAACTEDHRQRAWDERARRYAATAANGGFAPVAQHNDRTYRNWGCKCSDCIAAHSEAMQRDRRTVPA